MVRRLSGDINGRSLFGRRLRTSLVRHGLWRLRQSRATPSRSLSPEGGEDAEHRLRHGECAWCRRCGWS